MKRILLFALGILVLQACASQPAVNVVMPDAYLDNSGRDDALSGGVKMIPVTTPKGTFHVWTKRTGNNPTISGADMPYFI